MKLLKQKKQLTHFSKLYVRATVLLFLIRLNNRRKDVKNPNTIEECKHFDKWKHVSCTHGMYVHMYTTSYVQFILIEQMNNLKKCIIRGSEAQTEG